MGKLEPGINDLATTRPELANEADGWDPSKVAKNSGKKLRWRCALGHNWDAVVSNRSRRKSEGAARDGSGCPYCAGKKVWVGFNDLETTYPEIAKEADGWDPKTVTAGSPKRKSWKCKEADHPSFPRSPSERTSKGLSCPHCNPKGRTVVAGFNDLETLFPKVAAEAFGWDPKGTPPHARATKQWQCKLKHPPFPQAVYNRTGQKPQGCPYCSNQKVLSGFNDLATKFPELAKEADGWDPTTVLPGTHAEKDWLCPLGHPYKTTVRSRTDQDSGCHFCSGNAVLPGFNDFQSGYPELAKEAVGWDPSEFTRKSNTVQRWRCPKCKKNYPQTIANRANGCGCRECAKYGFKKSLPAWFYLLERPGEQQLGITNEPEVRLKNHQRYGWVELEVVGPANGKLVLETEKVLKQWLRTKVGLVPYTHENWFTSKLEVRSLAELKAKSGVETELF
ncbi:zinc-ribbon domain-containing protein [Synechococcus sp. MIT S9451]|uniref:zinc-ribbon domain-containing protein n=1 Tax=Synechococcus sp. MIT S9451 TaxID=3082543 RepID=UPI0039B57302